MKKFLIALLSIFTFFSKLIFASSADHGGYMSNSENGNAVTTNVICTRTKLKQSVVDEVRNWLNTLKSRKDEVLETFKEEGVWLESTFFRKSSRG